MDCDLEGRISKLSAAVHGQSQHLGSRGSKIGVQCHPLLREESKASIMIPDLKGRGGISSLKKLLQNEWKWPRGGIKMHMFRE